MITNSKALIVEDNAVVRLLTREMLYEMDYKVLAVDTAELGIDVLNKDADFSVIICDVSLGGGMTGLDLVNDRAVTLPPTVIVMSGNPRPEALPAYVRYLAKPFTMSQLANALPHNHVFETSTQ